MSIDCARSSDSESLVDVVVIVLDIIAAEVFNEEQRVEVARVLVSSTITTLSTIDNEESCDDGDGDGDGDDDTDDTDDGDDEVVIASFQDRYVLVCFGLIVMIGV